MLFKEEVVGSQYRHDLGGNVVLTFSSSEERRRRQTPIQEDLIRTGPRDNPLNAKFAFSSK